MSDDVQREVEAARERVGVRWGWCFVKRGRECPDSVTGERCPYCWSLRAILLAKAEECHKAASHQAGCSNTGDEDWDAAAQAFSQRLYKRAAALRKAAEELE